MAPRSHGRWALPALALALLRAALAVRVIERGCWEIPRRLPADLVHLVLDLAPVGWQLATWTRGQGLELFTPDRLVLDLPTRTGRQLPLQVNGVEFFPDGDRFLSWHPDGRVLIWDVLTGAVQLELHHTQQVGVARVFPAGDRVVACSDQDVCRVWDVASGHQLVTLGEPHDVAAHFYELVPDILFVNVFPAGDRVLTWGRRWWATAWDASDGSPVCALRSADAEVDVTEIFPAGDRVATAGFQDRVVRVWDIAKCSVLAQHSAENWIVSVAVLAHGRSVAAMDVTGRVSIFGAGSGEGPSTMRMASGPDSGVGLLAFHERNHLAVVNRDSVTIWDPVGEEVHRIKAPGIRRYAMSPRGDVLAICGVFGVLIWDAAAGARTLRPGSNATPRARLDCVMAFGLGRVGGFGSGVSWRDII